MNLIKKNYLLIFLLSFTFYFNCPAANASPIQNTETDQYVDLLLSGKWNVLTDELNLLLNETSKDESKEETVHRAFYQFYRANPTVGNALDQWIEAGPPSASAYLSRGIYRIKMGWASRGGNFSFQTTKSQFRNMDAWFAAAKNDLDLAIKINPKALEAYFYLIEIDMTQGGKNKGLLYTKIISLRPSSFCAREYYLHSQTPRWGGSYVAMEATIRKARRYYNTQPRLKALEGRVVFDYGELALHDGRLAEAVKYFNQALSYGNFWLYRQKLGEAFAGMGKHQDAINEFDQVVEQKPGYAGAWDQRARAFISLKKFDQALLDANRAVNIEPLDDANLALRGFVYLKMKNFALALKDFQMAASIRPGEKYYADTIEYLMSQLK